ncbi:GMC family oxidoreductase [Oculatella sp. FACHB-28]|uniref:FAD-dependent oxidoreductase n=1 Tax=Oculatella sp. FACHB-28 TaxID=2692845 RepID=UPI00168996B6|nr:GMC family oxidoreductase [Oculatella sp. FACHB-28]MBD2056318.1 GMC family oxidoreductase [Oculatella sp. FACHB-28]
MLIDSRTLPADQVVETDVCIVGAGPAGVTLARELAGQDFQVCLLESGGLDFDPDTQALCEGKTVSPQRYPADELHVGRCRQFGGSANYWCIQIDRDENQAHVRHVTPDDIDFEQRDWIPYSGWPFRKADLAPYYQKANAICKIGPDTYEAAAWETEQAKRLSFQGDRIQSSVFQFGPRAVFTHEYREELNHASNVTTYLNANVLEVETNETATAATGLRVATLDGKEFRVKARIVVLATGGFENARLLLLSDKVQKNGLGNQNDLVGRFFMDHPGFRFGVFIPADRKLFNTTALYDLHRVKGTPIMGKLTLSEEVLRQEKLLNICVMLVPRPSGYESKAVNSWRNLLSAVKRKQLPKEIWKHVKNVVSDLDDIVNYAYRRAKKLEFIYSPRMGGWSRRPADIRNLKAFEVIAQAEQTPNPENRVTLTDECDRLGRRKVCLTWRWSDIDLETIRRVQQILAQEFAQSELGEFQPRDEIEGGLPRFGSTHHHIGTTRMHPDPKQGVVDENCQVHGVSNLFIAGSSVFPTGGGYANPTLTIVALAVRLADHVKTTMAANVSTVNGSPV